MKKRKLTVYGRVAERKKETTVLAEPGFNPLEVIPEDEEIHLMETCNGESGFDDPHDHEEK